MTNAILPIEYVPGFVEFPDAALAALLNKLEWERRGCVRP